MPDDNTTAMFRVFIEGSMDDVWNEITRTDKPIAAFFNSRMHVENLESGERFAMRTPDGQFTGVVGEVVEVIPGRRFKHTFRFTSYDDPPCLVTYDLQPKNNGVEFTLTIEDMAPGTRSSKQMTQGGTMIVNTLKAVIETGRPSLTTRLLFGFFGLFQPLTPKRCRSEHWPIGKAPDAGEPS